MNPIPSNHGHPHLPLLLQTTLLAASSFAPTKWEPSRGAGKGIGVHDTDGNGLVVSNGPWLPACVGVKIQGGSPRGCPALCLS